MYSDIIQSNPLKVEKLGIHRLGGKLMPMPVSAGYEPRGVLPISGSEFILRSTTKKSDRSYYVDATNSARKSLFGVRVDEKETKGNRKVECSKSEAKLILESLRIAQLVVFGVNQRKHGEEFHPLLQDVFEICKCLEEICDGHKRKLGDLEKYFASLMRLLSNRFSTLIRTISNSLTAGNLPTDEQLNLGLEHEKMYFKYDESSSSYDLEKYLGQPPDYDTKGPLQDAIKQLVREFLWNSTISAINHHQSSITNVVNYPFPEPRIPDFDQSDPYLQSSNLCQAVAESNSKRDKE